MTRVSKRIGRSPDNPPISADIVKESYAAAIKRMLTELKRFPKGNSRSAAIRRHCIDCSGFSPAEVALCPHQSCNLWPYRFGRNAHDASSK
jgi:hypothetical protein